MKKNLFVILIIFSFIYTNAQEVKVTSGKIQRFENFNSKLIDSRNIDVWLPDGYSNKEKYAVLYMNDGQALYDAETTWNKQAWEVDQTAGKLIADGKTKKFIVVGIWNNGQKRHAEYFPQKPYESLTQIQKDTIDTQLQKAGRNDNVFKPYSDLYLQFLVKELKPFIDQNFSTKIDQKNTFIAGSSMGGLISMYAICEYPKIFGGAACISTHWPGTFSIANNPIPEAFINYLKMNLPNSKDHKIYFDYGDQTLDALYKPYQEKADEVIKTKGFTSKNWETKFFPGENHSEEAWAKRLNIPLVFLLNK
ncbi:alpha/beta hydrolase [Flavobacterium aquicola]|uniref:Putative alpha/beta superfamily hydrolase n=1 Tax=Flavobacterium aquicola TaxID=1682742 RepID=A0A3E0ESH8_9FLAO|nr:alpha/beta hydrolase-fold protein [Flavobacterium aquicola]REH01158.1 putative alpha/beta superfamily hydrolase [Flavobacterium aquicola]